MIASSGSTARPEELEYFPFYVGGDSFDIALGEYLSKPEGKLVSSFLNEKKHTIKDTFQSYRLINHWSTLGLLDDERSEESRQWRKLSMLDIVWVNVLVEMRKFGFPLEKLHIAKNSLCQSKNKDHPYFLLEFAVVNVLLRNSQQVVIVLADGKAGVLEEQMVQLNREWFGLKSFLSININTIVSRIFNGKDFFPMLTHLVSLTNEEIEVILEMRQGHYSCISIKMRDGHIELIESTETMEGQKRFIDLLKDGDYQDIEVKKRDGKIVSIKRTKQRKPTATGKTRAPSTSISRLSEKPKSKADSSNAHN
ncbi:MAG: hypothetical protein WCG83_01220 [Candidatus Peregrinibacteria bacterium]